MSHLFGYAEFQQFLSQLQGRFQRALNEALQDAALLVEKEAKQNIAQGRPEWPRLARSTVLSRIRRRSAGRRALRRARALRRRGVGIHARAAVLLRALRRGTLSSPFTPLYDTGTLLRSITHEVDQDRAVVGPTVEYAAIHETGGTAGRYRRTRIPSRPYLVPAARENLPHIRSLFLLHLSSTRRRHGHV